MGVYGGVTNSWINLSPSNSLNGLVTSGLVLALDAGRTLSLLNSVEVLVVAGGGGGGGSTAGGGGAGGVIYNRNFAVTPGSALTVTVGAGGQGTVRADQGVATNTNGGNSVFGSLTAIGGGKGYSGSHIYTPGSSAVGGSGGGGGYYSGGLDPKGSGTSSAGTAGQGFAGGDGAAINEWGGGGGGGAGGPGGAQVADNTLRTGGPGLGFNISGTFQYYGGGGGGGAFTSGFSLGGIGGGGNGGDGQTYTPTAGTTNTGGGGGGGGYYQFGPGGAAGGSGIVIVRYQGAQRATGGTVTSSGGYTIHTFTTVGSTTFTPLTWTDLSGNGNNGTLTNGPTYSSANGGSIVFDGTDDYILITQTLSTPFTITGFVRYTDQAKILNMYMNTNPHTVLGISLNRTGIGDLYVYIGNGSGWFATPAIISSTNMIVNRWYQVTFTSTGSGSILYLDGVNVGTSIHSPSGWGSSYYLGGAIEVMRGNIATTQIYNKALTATEVLQNYNATRRRFGI